MTGAADADATAGPAMKDEIVSILDDALRDTLSEVEDAQLAARAQRHRVVGLSLLVLSIALILPVAVLQASNRAIGSLLLGSAAILLLIGGGWLVDRAAHAEIRAHRSEFSGGLMDALRDADEGLMQAKIRRRRFFAISMLVLSGFCMAVAATPFPGKQEVDAPLWTGFAVALIAVGVWQLLVATREARRATAMMAAAMRRAASRTGDHLTPVKR